MNFTTRISLLSASLLVSSFLLTACDTKSSDYNFDQNAGNTPDPDALPHGPVFDPASKKIPTTNDLLRVNGRLNFPNPANDKGDKNPVISAINALDGFSTTNPITIDFGMEVDPATLAIGEGVRVFQVEKEDGQVKTIKRELTKAEIVAVQTADKKIAIVPMLPLAGSSSYAVILTNSITDKEGKPAEKPARYLTNMMETKVIEFALAETASKELAEENIIMGWSFTTQSIGAVLKTLAAEAKAGDIVIAPTGMTTKDIKDALPGIADVYIGTLKVPYYLEKPSVNNPLAPLNGYWKDENGKSIIGANKPVQNGSLTIPVIMTIPNANSGKSKPDDGWQTAIYQHGITRMRTDILAYADSMAAAGIAVIAIDLPLHGIPKLLADGSDNGFHASNTAFPNDVEPSFDVDYVNNTTSAPGPDNKADGSGTHFMNLASLLTSRDNIRQAVSNLLVLRRSLENIDIDADGSSDINAKKVGFISHSLGGVVAVPYLAVETKEMPSSLVAAGASITKILTVTAADMAEGNEDANPFGKQVKNGLAAKGIKDGKYQSFMYGAQFVLESADPINYAQAAVAAHPIHLIKITGDKVVRNDTTDVLSGLMGATAVSSTVTDIKKGKAGLVTFNIGNHSSVLDPARGGNFLNVFAEIHKQLVTFQATSGSSIVISDDAIIKQ
ncbi:MAG TPA: hypothetical protein EYG71_01060 [Leucothrix sp.]|nr:hypothetical protein [Leucothrix sp.]